MLTQRTVRMTAKTQSEHSDVPVQGPWSESANRTPALRLPLQRAISTAIGGGLGIAVMAGLAKVAGLPLMIVPFTTSVVLVMGAPQSQQSQPRNIVGGHLISALIGLCVAAAFGSSPWLAALAVGVSIAAMQLT